LIITDNVTCPFYRTEYRLTGAPNSPLGPRQIRRSWTSCGDKSRSSSRTWRTHYSQLKERGILLGRRRGHRIRCTPCHTLLCYPMLCHLLDPCIEVNTTSSHRFMRYPCPPPSFPLQVLQADVHSKIMQALGQRDMQHQGNVRVTQEQYSRQMTYLREEQLKDRRRSVNKLACLLACPIHLFMSIA
jgi:hypothetical protein